MLPVYFIDQGIERGLGNSMLSASRTLSIPVVLIGGWLTDRIGVRRSLMIILITGGGTNCSHRRAAGVLVVCAGFSATVVCRLFFPSGVQDLGFVGAGRVEKSGRCLYGSFRFSTGGPVWHHSHLVFSAMPGFSI
ncbi:MAG: hypothetical protein JRE56_07895 [Deltaproteobacteria bacterium]|jgi:MFS family permease|nr:hypothetical protein [Deltaproteobacteria bacterium]